MKTTTRLYDIIHSTYNKLYGDFQRDTNIIYFNQNIHFTSKVATYDDEIKTVCRNTIFYGLDFLDESVRERFEAEFLSRFLTRKIKFQTWEVLNWRLVSFTRGIKEIITNYYTNADKYLQGYSQSNASGKSNSQGETLSRDNSLAISLPQDNTNMSLDQDVYDYADTSAHSKSKANNTTSQDTTQTSDTITYDIARLTELKALHDDIFKDLDTQLFSQIL